LAVLFRINLAARFGRKLHGLHHVPGSLCVCDRLAAVRLFGPVEPQGAGLVIKI
jgi:hypothetical protein